MASESRVVRFLLTGDAKSAIRAMRDTAEASEHAGKQLDKTGGQAEKAHKHFAAFRNLTSNATSFLGLSSGLIGIGALGLGIKKAVSAGMEFQSQQVQLQQALRNTGQLGGDHLNKINTAIEATATKGGFAPPEETQAIAQFIRLTGSANKAIELNTEATTLARGAHLEYANAAKIVAQAQTGSTGRLQRYLGIIQPVTRYVKALTSQQKKLHPELLRQAELMDKTATAGEANRQLMARFGGSAAAFSHTAAGAFSNLRNTVDLILEKLGAKLLPVVTTVGRALASVAQTIISHWSQIGKVFSHVFGVLKAGVQVVINVVKWVIQMRGVFLPLAIGVGVAAAAVGGFIAVVYAGNIAIAAMTALTTGLGVAFEVLTGPIGIIFALSAAVAFAYMHFKVFREVVNTVFATLKSVVSEVVTFVVQHWELMLAAFFLPAAIGVEIVKHFTAIKNGIVGVFESIGGVVSSIWHGIVTVVQGAINLIIKGINGVISGYNAVQRSIPFGLGAAQVKLLPELGAHAPAAAKPIGAAATGAQSAGGARQFARPNVHVHFELNGKELAHGLVKDPWAPRILAESNAHYTLKRAARR